MNQCAGVFEAVLPIPSTQQSQVKHLQTVKLALKLAHKFFVGGRGGFFHFQF